MILNYNIDDLNIFLCDFEDYQNFIEDKLDSNSDNAHLELIEGMSKIKSYKLPENIKSLTDKEMSDKFSKITQSVTEQVNLLIENKKHTEFYTHSFRSSFLVQIFSVFEYELISICNKYYLENNTDYKLKDLKGNSDIEKAKIYLTKTCKVDFSEFNEIWSYINTIRKIRNKIVHHQSRISRLDNDWIEISDFIFKNEDKIWFSLPINYMEKENIDSIYGKDGLIEFQIRNEKLNFEFIKKVKTFFEKLLVQLN